MKGDIEILREAILLEHEGSDVGHAWRRIEALVMRVDSAANVHDLAEAIGDWRKAERMAAEMRAKGGGK